MNCRSCGNEIQDDVHCKYCGQDQRIRSAPTQQQIEYQRSVSPQPLEVKDQPIVSPRRNVQRSAYKANNPKLAWVTVALNLFPVVMGLGYIYLDNWKRFGITFGIQALGGIPLAMMGFGDSANMLIYVPLYIWSLVYGYYQTKVHNDKLVPVTFPSST